MIKLTLADYQSMDKPVRDALRRKACGHPRALPPQLEGQFDLAHLRTILVQENERTAVMPTKWTETADDELAESLAAPADVVDFMRGGAMTREDVIHILRAIKQQKRSNRFMRDNLSISQVSRGEYITLLNLNNEQLDNYARVILALAGPLAPVAAAQYAADAPDVASLRADFEAAAEATALLERIDNEAKGPKHG